MDLNIILHTIEEHKKSLREFGISRIGVFGSQYTGAATEKSDIDLLVDFIPNQKTYRNFLGSSEVLESLFTRPVDIVTADGLSPLIKPHIEKNIHYVQITN